MLVQNVWFVTENQVTMLYPPNYAWLGEIMIGSIM